MNDDHTISVFPDTIQQAFDNYLVAITSSMQCSPRTVEIYKHTVNKLIVFLENESVVEMQKINTDLLRKFFLDLQSKHSQGGVHHIYRPVKAFLLWYWDEFELETRWRIGKVVEARGNAESGLVQANEMALTIGVKHGIFNKGIGSYEGVQGSFPLFKRTIVEDQWKIGTTMEEYVGDLRKTILEKDSKIAIYHHRGRKILGFYSKNKIPIGHLGNEPKEFVYVIISYLQNVIISGYQVGGLSSVDFPEHVKWIK